MQLINKVVLLTGATGGIGSAMAATFAREGATMLLIGRRVDELNRLVEQLPGDNHRAFPCDLTDSQQRDKLVTTLRQERASIDVLINAAGLSTFACLQHSDPRAVDQLVACNLLAAIQLTRSILPLLNTQGARIINIGSTLGSIGYPGYTVYCATKFGLRGFSEALSRELSDTAIQVQYIAPRATCTDANSSSVVRMNQSLGNAMDTPEDVADCVLKAYRSGRFQTVYGWPERLLVPLAGLCRWVVNIGVKQQLSTIKHFAQENNHATTKENV